MPGHHEKENNLGNGDRTTSADKKMRNDASNNNLMDDLKSNNEALAKALSKEKEETQYLFTQNIALKRKVQELEVACNTRDSVLADILDNAKSSLGLLVTLSNHVTNIIGTCQQMVTSPRYKPRKSQPLTECRETNRNSLEKSPARGVVQPMVNGCAITKPTIHLSRLNIEREYRVFEPSNLSDIDEVSLSLEQQNEQLPDSGPLTFQSNSEISMGPPMSFVRTRVNRMPERFRYSLRSSDESERRSSVRRSTSRNSLRCSDQGTEVLPRNDSQIIKSPRVSLQDISSFLQNSPTANIRTLIENSRTAANNVSEVVTLERSSPEVSRRGETENSSDVENSVSESRNPTPGSAIRRKTRENVTSRIEDPLEGPSWLLNDLELSENNNRSDEGNGEKRVMPGEESLSGKGRNFRRENGNMWENEVNGRHGVTYSYERGCESDNDDDDGEEEEEEEEEEEDSETTTFANFVTRKRGSQVDDTEDFTMMWRHPPARNFDFDINELELPRIESPIVKVPAEMRRPIEPELTANVQSIVTQNFGNLSAVCPTINEASTSPLALLPSPRSASFIENEWSEEDSCSSPVRKRLKSTKKRAIPILDSSDEDDTEETSTTSRRHGTNVEANKDPSSAKVVLEKMEYEWIGVTGSPEARRQQLLLPDNLQTRARPRREKAPKNLKEPSLSGKLRRE